MHPVKFYIIMNMKKVFTFSTVMCLAINAMAQQIPNNGFEEAWGDCIPWTSTNSTTVTGTTPAPWTISQVSGLSGLGATTVGEKVEGYESPSAVKVFNAANPMMPTQIVPGYVTLGTTWSTSMLGTENDGGTFGGHEFTGRPAKVTFMYKFERSAENENTQPANAIVYLWKGTFTQAEVPGDIHFGTPTTVSMVNRDRNILGMETAKGGEVTKSDDAELIAVGKLVITETTSEWAKGEVLLEYKSDATPEMINVIFSANDYFSDQNIIAGNSLTVDKVECVYEDTPVAGNVKKYPGKLTVEMNNSAIAEDVDATIEITPNADNTACTFLLPNLTLGDLGTVGDIKVDEVGMATDSEGVTTFNGTVENMELMDGNINATVDINGACDASGKLAMVIDVIWHSPMGDMPIKVTFNGQGEPVASVNSIEADADAVAEYYNLEGMRMDASSLTPGIYVVRRGNKVNKVLIK